jgi:hypothetical protein
MLCGTRLQGIYQATIPKGNKMKVLIHENIATTEQCKEYYAERFNPPYALISRFGDTTYRVSVVSKITEKQELLTHKIGSYYTFDEASDACFDLVFDAFLQTQSS